MSHTRSVLGEISPRTSLATQHELCHICLRDRLSDKAESIDDDDDDCEDEGEHATRQVRCEAPRCINYVCKSDAVCDANVCAACARKLCVTHAAHCVTCSAVFCRSCRRFTRDPAARECDACYSAVVVVPATQLPRQSDGELDAQLLESMRFVYLSSTLSDFDRRLFVYNLCVRRWQHELTAHHGNRKYEPLASRVTDTGDLMPPSDAAATPAKRQRRTTTQAEAREE